jgi:hypothetical protein
MKLAGEIPTSLAEENIAHIFNSLILEAFEYLLD